MGAIMYRLAEMDFSDRLGVVVGELVPDEMDRKEETLKAKGSKASDLATAYLDVAVFSAP
jgi:hypothetical protein